MDKIFEVFLLLLGFGSILFLAYVTSKLVAGKSNKAMKGKYITVIETVSLGVDKRLYLIKAGKQFILIASSGKSVEFLSKIDIEDYDELAISQENLRTFDFKAIFDKYINTTKEKKQRKIEKDIDLIEDDNNSGDNLFKFNLERLKNITKGISGQSGKSGDENTNEK